MYRVVLADDEMLDLEGMERLLPWQELGMEVVCAASNGFEALDYLRQEKADILVSDIRMPIMSGLELVRLAKELQPELQVLFVSGHEDFQYAKQAIEMNAHGYVLKPVDDKELIRLLGEVRHGLDDRVKRSRLEQAYQETIPLALNELLLRWFRGEATYESVSAYLEEAGIPSTAGEVQAALVEVDDLGLKWGGGSEEERTRFLSRWSHFIQEYAGSSDIVLQIRVEPFVMLLVLRESDGLAKLQELLQLVRDTLALTVTIGLSNAVSGIDQLPLAYSEARTALDYKIFCGKNRVITPHDTQDLLLREVNDLDEVLNQLFSAMSQYELVRVDDCLEELFVMIKQLGKKLTVHNFTLYIISKLDTYLAGLNENLQSILGIPFNQLDILFHFETVDDIQSWLRRRLFEISELLQLKKAKKNSKIISEIEEYVEGKLGGNIVLRDVAEQFSFSPNYLGHLFKEETGTNFSDYVVRRKMEKAHELLQDPRLKVYEVASQVGYKNLTHFNKLFKERYGVTPNEYRRQA
ncbi:response regulator [Paenibacillus sp. GCM10023252]|uniref:response regulator n=1 Tax=Paenibacillus sp. GCM10023252 TaxID=3252649 RepID=UPI003613DC6C